MVAPADVGDDLQRVDLGLLLDRGGAGERDLEAGHGLGEAAEQVLALGAEHVNREGELVLGLPGVGAEEPSRDLEVAQGDVVGCRALGPLAGDEVEPRQLITLLRGVDEVHAHVELIDDLEDPRLALALLEVLEEEAADAEVELFLEVVGDEGVRRLAHAIVEELVADRERVGVAAEGARRGGLARRLGLEILVLVADGEDEARLNGVPEIGRDLERRALADDREGLEVERGADAGGEPHHALRGLGELADPLRHQPGDVVGDAGLLDALEVPLPPSGVGREREELVRVERGEELIDEEGVAFGPVMDDAGERLGGLVVGAAQRVEDHPAHVAVVERAQGDLFDQSLLLAELREHERERVGAVDLVVAVGADDQEVPCPRVREQEANQAERGAVGPLEVVEEDRQRVLAPGKHVDEALEDEVEAVLRLGRPDHGHRLLLAHDQRDLGDHVDHHLAARPEGLVEALAQRGYLLLALGEELADQALEGLDHRAVRGVVELVEFARGEVAAPLGDRPLDLVHQG